MDKNFEKIIKRLVEYLNYYCSSKGNLHISEDTLRYFFFAAVLDLYGVKKVTKCGKRKPCCESNICKEVLVNIEQEVPLDDRRIDSKKETKTNKPSELDTLLKIDKKTYAIEFKRHFKNQNNQQTTGGATQFMGLLVNDIHRLSNIENKAKDKGVNFKYQITLIDEDTRDTNNDRTNNTTHELRELFFNPNKTFTKKEVENQYKKADLANGCKEKIEETYVLKNVKYYEVKISKYDVGTSKEEGKENKKEDKKCKNAAYYLYIYKVTNKEN